MSKTTNQADLFWDAADTEQSYHDVSDILDLYPCGEVVRVQRAVRLHDVFAVRVGDDMASFDTLAEAEAWADEHEGRLP